jgi:hypothetical protein
MIVILVSAVGLCLMAWWWVRLVIASETECEARRIERRHGPAAGLKRSINPQAPLRNPKLLAALARLRKW